MFLPDNSIFTPVTDPNMDPSRTASRRLSVEERITSFDEVDATYTEEQALNESGRCLKCPTHWCQKACPAGVPVTDFIARVRAHDYEGAYQLIRSASMLPEMCSRVCPQEKQCQSNCTRGIRGQSVGIGRLERFVIEEHYRSGKPDAAAPANGKRVAVIGAGPSGLSAAERLTDKGFSVTIYEGADRAGGLLEYGIPNMKLEKGVIARKVEAMQKRGVAFKLGTPVNADNADEIVKGYDAVILCVGTGNARSLKLEGAEHVRGILPAVEYLTASTKAVLDGDEPTFAKDKQVVVVGGGDTGSDCVGTAIRQGCTGLTQIEMLPRNPVPAYIHHVYPVHEPEHKVDTSMEECEHVFGKDPHVYQTTVKAVEADAEGNLTAVVTVDLAASYDEGRRLTLTEVPGSEKKLPCELLIVAAGFIGPEAELARAFGVETGERTNIAANGYATNVPGVFACGDCRTGQSLVVKAMVDGRACADTVAETLK